MGKTPSIICRQLLDIKTNNGINTITSKVHKSSRRENKVVEEKRTKRDGKRGRNY